MTGRGFSDIESRAGRLPSYHADFRLVLERGEVLTKCDKTILSSVRQEITMPRLSCGMMGNFKTGCLGGYVEKMVHDADKFAGTFCL